MRLPLRLLAPLCLAALIACDQSTPPLQAPPLPALAGTIEGDRVKCTQPLPGGGHTELTRYGGWTLDVNRAGNHLTGTLTIGLPGEGIPGIPGLATYAVTGAIGAWSFEEEMFLMDEYGAERTTLSAPELADFYPERLTAGALTAGVAADGSLHLWLRGASACHDHPDATGQWRLDINVAGTPK